MNKAYLLWLRVTWWVIAVLTTLVSVFYVPARIASVQAVLTPHKSDLLQLGLSPGLIIALLVGINFLVLLAMDTIAILMVTRRPNDWVALLIAMAFIIQGANQLTSLGENFHAAGLFPSVTMLPAVLAGFGFILGVASLFVFPDGRFVPRWSWVAIPIALAGVISRMVVPVARRSPQSLGIAFEITFYSIGLACLMYRYYSVANARQREQIKWVLFGYGCLPIIWGMYGLTLVLWPLSNLLDPHEIIRQLVSSSILTVATLLLPLTFAIAIIRHKLWDIDFIINRTLVYLALTGILAGFYTGTVTLLQRIFILLTGGQSITAYVIATLFIAATFTPFKEVLQKAADRRFKETPARTRRLQALTDQLRTVVDVFDIPRMTGSLLEEAVEAFNAQVGAVYLESTLGLELIHKQGHWQPDKAAITIPMAANGRHVGLLQLGARSDGNAYSPRDREMLQAAAAQVARVLELTQYLRSHQETNP